MSKLPVTITEPALVRGLTVALAMLASVGVGWAADVPNEDIALWASVLVVVIPIAQALWTRYVVTPRRLVVAQVTPDGAHVIAGDASSVPTGKPVALLDEDDPGVATTAVVPVADAYKVTSP